MSTVRVANLPKVLATHCMQSLCRPFNGRAVAPHPKWGMTMGISPSKATFRAGSATLQRDAQYCNTIPLPAGEVHLWWLDSTEVHLLVTLPAEMRCTAYSTPS